MLQIIPQDAILFTKAGNELVGMVEITNIIQAPVTYKVCVIRVTIFHVTANQITYIHRSKQHRRKSFAYDPVPEF